VLDHPFEAVVQVSCSISTKIWPIAHLRLSRSSILYPIDFPQIIKEEEVRSGLVSTESHVTHLPDDICVKILNGSP
jgi:hypothetical protein